MERTQIPHIVFLAKIGSVALYCQLLLISFHQAAHKEGDLEVLVLYLLCS